MELIHPIRDGVMDAPNGHERHALRARFDEGVVCVVDSPLTGREAHAPDDAYPADENPK